jgi:hypothetical protein
VVTNHEAYTPKSVGEELMLYGTAWLQNAENGLNFTLTLPVRDKTLPLHTLFDKILLR